MSKILHITNIELYEYLVGDKNTYFYHSVSKSDTIKCGLALRADQNFALYKNYNDGKFRIARALNGSYSNFLWGTVSVWYRQIDPDYNDFVFRIGNNDNFIFTINNVTYTETNNTVDFELLNCRFGIDGKCKYLHFNDNEKLIPAKLKGTLYQGNAADAKIHYEDECGMFDIVNNIFYANESATGTFTVENKIDEIKINGDIKYIAIVEDNIVIYPKRVYFANSNNTLKLVYERPTYDIHIVNLAINNNLGNANKITDIVFTNNLLLQKKAYNNNIVDVTFNHFKTVEFLVQNDDNDTFTCYIANAFWGENSKVYCYGDFGYCFESCNLLEKIPLENFNTDNVTRFRDAFLYCRTIKTIDIEHLVLPQNLKELVYGCSKLVRLKLKLPANADLNGAFHNCTKLRYLDIFENAININAEYMFNAPSNLKSVYFKNTTFSNTKKLFYNAHGIVRIFCETLIFQDDLTFSDCISVKGGNGTAYDANHINSEYARIDGENGLPGYFTDPAEAKKITLINVDNEGYTDEIYLCAGDTYTLETLQGYTAVVSCSNGNTYSDGDTITITQDITLTFVWSAVNNN